jgi:hypothetical protein
VVRLTHHPEQRRRTKVEKYYLARFAPYVFFVPFVVNYLEFVLRGLRDFVVSPLFSLQTLRLSVVFDCGSAALRQIGTPHQVAVAFPRRAAPFVDRPYD